MEELGAFDDSLVKRPQILVANKIDLLGKKTLRLEKVESLARKHGLPFFAISALKREGIRELITAMVKELDAQSAFAERA
jgi:GTP-binding protein